MAKIMGYQAVEISEVGFLQCTQNIAHREQCVCMIDEEY
jgi:hypothetical protein